MQSLCSFPSLHQHPPGGRRTESQQAGFDRALEVMGDLYASVVGTMVLVSKDVPPRPPEFDGALGLYDLVEGVDANSIHAALAEFGDIVSIEIGGHPDAKVRFSTHEAALKAKRAAARLSRICGGIGTLYNDRSYDGREGEEGDKGRGWCQFELAVSGELIVRLRAYPKLEGALNTLPPKVLALSSTAPIVPVDLRAEALETRVDEVVARIDAATFTGKGDKSMVIDMYKAYVGRIAAAIQKTLALSEVGVQEALELPPLPTVSVPDAAPLRLADGQLLLLLSGAGAPAGGDTRFGVVDRGGVVCTLTPSDAVPPSFDGCSQSVLPWQPSLSPGWEEAMTRDVAALRPLDGRVRRLSAEVLTLAGAIVLPATAPELEARVRSAATDAAAILEVARAQPAVATVAEAASKAVHAAFDTVLASLARHQLSSASEPLRLDVQPLSAQLARLQPEALAAAALRASGGMGHRRYRPGQWLTVRAKGKWIDVEVAEGGMMSDGQELRLHPWNHALRELPYDAFESVRAWWTAALREQHQYIRDALTLKPLRVLDQTVPIDVTDTELAGIKSAIDLGYKLTELHTKCCLGPATDRPAALLLEGPPASGKTCLMSQVVMRTLQQDETVPILIKVQQLQRRKLQSPEAFATAWNWIDAYLRLEYDEAVHRMLRQVRPPTSHSHTQRPQSAAHNHIPQL